MNLINLIDCPTEYSDIVYGPLQFLMVSVQANITNYDLDIKNTEFFAGWELEDPFIEIYNGITHKRAENYYLPEHKSNRGRKKKKVEAKGRFKSNINFTTRRFMHREKKKDAFAKTSSECELDKSRLICAAQAKLVPNPSQFCSFDQHYKCIPCGTHAVCPESGISNCEIIAKNYHLRIFNGGKIVCVGVTKRNKEDFFECVEAVKKYIIDRWMEHYCKLKLPIYVFDILRKTLQEKYQIVDIISTLENYQFSIKNKKINLYLLRDIFISESSELINIDYEKLYKFLAESCFHNEFNFNINTVVSNLELQGMKHVLVSRKRLTEILNLINLKVWMLEFLNYWQDLTEIQKGSASINNDIMKFAYLKQFIIYKFKPSVICLNQLDMFMSENVIFKEDKSTLLIEKKMSGLHKDFKESVTMRFFSSGICNIQGTKSYESASVVYEYIKNMFKFIPNVLYEDCDNPPIIDFRDYLI